MKPYDIYRGDDGRFKLRVPQRGDAVMRRALLNKGTAFTARERVDLHLEGLLPSQTNTMEQQAGRVHRYIARKQDELEKYFGLAALQDRNEHLFYRVLCDRLEDYMPIVYTPTVGRATREFSAQFRRGRGVWITPEHRGRIAKVLARGVQYGGVKLLVVTDNESILGIGDQGAGGMAISVGKLSLYCAGAGIHPAKTLPVSLDVGTNNEHLLNHDLYLGWRQRRLAGQEYDELLDEFVEAVVDVFPGAVIQWEDFRKDNALRILQKYRHRVPSFNDDIQGTGAVALAGLFSAMRVTGVAARDQRIVIHGAGAAGLGIARQLRAGLSTLGLDEAELVRAVAVLDSRGLVVDDREIRDDYKRELAWPASLARGLGLEDAANRDLAAVVAAYRPNVLIGSSGQAGAFTEAIVRNMAENTERPVILPFSNPTDYAEARPRDVLAWTDGRALVATGSPFDDVEYEGRRIRVGQGNNVFIFPGLGLSTLLSGATEVTDNMISAASRALADSVTDDDLSSGLLYPAIPRLRVVSRQVTAAVMRQAIEDGVAPERTDAEISERIDLAVWVPEYPDYEAV